MTVIQDIIVVGEENENLPSRNKALVVVDGSGDNDEAAEMRNDEAFGDSKNNPSGKNTLRVWCNQIRKRTRNRFLRAC